VARALTGPISIGGKPAWDFCRWGSQERLGEAHGLSCGRRLDGGTIRSPTPGGGERNCPRFYGVSAKAESAYSLRSSSAHHSFLERRPYEIRRSVRGVGVSLGTAVGTALVKINSICIKFDIPVQSGKGHTHGLPKAEADPA
jgi:hypothetical protein